MPSHSRIRPVATFRGTLASRSATPFTTLTVYPSSLSQLPPFTLSTMTMCAHFPFHATSLDGESVRSICLGHDIAYDRLDDVFADFSVDLRPTRIANVKQGLEAFQTLSSEDCVRCNSRFGSRTLRGDCCEIVSFRLSTSLEVHGGLQGKTACCGHYKTAVQLLGVIVLADTGGFGDPQLFANESPQTHRNRSWQV